VCLYPVWTETSSSGFGLQYESRAFSGFFAKMLGVDIPPFLYSVLLYISGYVAVPHKQTGGHLNLRQFTITFRGIWWLPRSGVAHPYSRTSGRLGRQLNNIYPRTDHERPEEE
jgi:hypothetical protein